MKNKNIETLKQLKNNESTIYKWLHEFCEEEKGNDEKLAKYEHGIKFMEECDEALDYAIDNIRINENLRAENRNLESKLETALQYIDMLKERENVYKSLWLDGVSYIAKREDIPEDVFEKLTEMEHDAIYGKEEQE